MQIKTIVVRRLDLQFDTDSTTQSANAQQVNQVIEEINLVLQREPFGLNAQLIIHPDEIEIETNTREI